MLVSSHIYVILGAVLMLASSYVSHDLGALLVTVAPHLASVLQAFCRSHHISWLPRILNAEFKNG